MYICNGQLSIPISQGREEETYSIIPKSACSSVRLLPQRNEKVVAKWNKSYLVKMRVEFHLKRPFRQDVVCEMRGCTRCDGESNSSLATGAVTRYSSHSLAVVGDAVCFLKGEERGGRTDTIELVDRGSGEIRTLVQFNPICVTCTWKEGKGRNDRRRIVEAPCSMYSSTPNRTLISMGTMELFSYLLP